MVIKTKWRFIVKYSGLCLDGPLKGQIIVNQCQTFIHLEFKKDSYKVGDTRGQNGKEYRYRAGRFVQHNTDYVFFTCQDIMPCPMKAMYDIIAENDKNRM